MKKIIALLISLVSL
jgi:hypothetical protein